MNREKKYELKDRLREALDHKGMKPADLADITGIPKSMVSYYLSGKSVPRADRIYEIAKVLDVSEAWIMGFDVPMEKEKQVSPDERQLTEGEEALLALFRRVPEDKQQLVLQMIRAAISTQESS